MRDNEKVYLLAKKAAITLFLGSEPLCGIGISTYKQKLRDSRKKLKAFLWENLPGIRHSKIFIGILNRKRPYWK